MSRLCLVFVCIYNLTEIYFTPPPPSFHTIILASIKGFGLGPGAWGLGLALSIAHDHWTVEQKFRLFPSPCFPPEEEQSRQAPRTSPPCRQCCTRRCRNPPHHI